MPPLNNPPSGAGGVIRNTPLIPPVTTPSTGLRTRELHGPDYYHIGSPADPGYAENMRAMFGKDDSDPPRQESPRQEQQSMGSSSRGSSSHYSHPNLGWQSRLGQGPFQAVESFRLAEWIPERLVCNVCSTLVRPRSRSYLRRIWSTRRSIC